MSSLNLLPREPVENCTYIYGVDGDESLGALFYSNQRNIHVESFGVVR